MKFFRIIRSFFFGSSTIAVGHGRAKDERSCVVMFVGRKYVALSPGGARKLADQLRVWADHAEHFGNSVTTMKWIINASIKGVGEEETVKWIATKLEETASNMGAEASKTDA